MERRKKKASFDPFHYAAYLPDDESVDNIEERFALLDKLENTTDVSSTTNEEIARRVFIQTASPNQVPIDMWFEMEEMEKNGFDDDDENFTPSYGDDDNDDYVPRGRREYGSSGQRKKGGKGGQHSTFASTAQIEHMGSGVDLWPAYKVQQNNSSKGTIITHREFPNREVIMTRSQFLQSLSKGPTYNIVDKITVSEINKIVASKRIDAIIMDPPFGHNGWTHESLRLFLKEIKPFLSQTFIVIWADPSDVAGTVDAFAKNEYVFCDSIAVELLDNFERPLTITSDKCGLYRNSRMAIMWRTDDIGRSDLRQQRVKDTGFGVVYPGGKTYGRLSMPMTVHNNIEVMLPPRKDQGRVFVELWPTFFSRRKGWVVIDEKEVLED